MFWIFFSEKEKRRLMLTPDLGLDEADDSDSSHSHTAPDDVLVVTLGVINECPGMLSEYQVCIRGTRYRYCTESGRIYQKHKDSKTASQWKESLRADCILQYK